ncbi:hypothetical protein SMSP2_01009 [Limihaloglobus sulfuriphilus]|uniref:Tetratricopeptide repeat protein n=2 Tax=Limihaloglobus sulfuriphilus TaxID=1851148 RepID=A0A1Q2MD75_9BACT|nr:hypothetical protein SMSP2_01009 [Limihaloglobus sulfuriphilus]
MTVCAVIAAVSGCNPTRSNLDKFNSSYTSGNYDDALSKAEKWVKGNETPAKNDVLWALNAGSVKMLLGDYEGSIEWFDRAEEFIGYYDYENVVLNSLGSTLINDTAIPYGGTRYDRIMLNTYKALNFMMLGDFELARVEFNRALERQNRAKDYFSKEINQLREDLSKYPDYRQYEQNHDIQDSIDRVYPSLRNFEPYPDFVNPFTTYLAGLFFVLSGDLDKGSFLLKETCGMVPGNPYVCDDFEAAEAAYQKGEIKNKVWVFFENGLGPVKDEFRIDLPLFVFEGSRVYYAGIALPRLVKRPGSAYALTINNGSEEAQTKAVVNMDRVVSTEFEKDFSIILARAVISASFKGAAQYALHREDSTLAAIMAIYSAATTTADVRIWSSLPKNIQVARTQAPQNGILTINNPSGSGMRINIGDCKNAIVYVRIPFAGAEPVYNVIKFN